MTVMDAILPKGSADHARYNPPSVSIEGWLGRRPLGEGGMGLEDIKPRIAATQRAAERALMDAARLRDTGAPRVAGGENAHCRNLRQEAPR